MESYTMYQRRSTGETPLNFHTKISSLALDHILVKEVKEVPDECMCPNVRPRRRRKRIISGSCRRSRRIRKATSVLRGKLYDSLFDHCFRNIWRESPEEKTNPCTYLSCLWFYMYTQEIFRPRVLSWIKRQNIFSKTYVFVPIVLWSHWSLLIFCHLGESSPSKTKNPCMLLLDSLHSLGPLRLEPLIRRFVSDIYETEGIPESNDRVERIPLLIPNVPQQRNGEECGVFVLYYIHLFLENAPENFSICSGYPYFMKEDWFTEERLEGFYDRLESLGLESSDSEE